MKKLIFTFCVLMHMFTSANAQQNSLLVYGNLNVSSSKNGSGIKSNAFSVSPGVGYQFTGNWTTGINLEITSNKVGALAAGDPAIKSSSFGVGPFIRYAQPLSDIFAIYGQLNTNYLTNKADGIRSNGFSANLFPAIGVNLKNGFALNFNFGSLGYYSYKPKESKSTSNFGLSFGSGAGFGISKNFGL